MLSKCCCFCIKLYWRFVPEERRIICLYKESCSRYIYSIFEEQGVFGGFKALKYRFMNCHSDYELFRNGSNVYIKTRTGQIIDEVEMGTPLFKASQVITKDK